MAEAPEGEARRAEALPPEAASLWTTSGGRAGWTISGRHSLERWELEEFDGDPRGLVWIYEEPSPRATYCMGIDPTVGITGWDRNLRTADDHKTDNGAVEIIRVGRNGAPDLQVCEFAAPIDPEDLADVANALGRLYAGNSDLEQCLSIIEVWPGPGLLTLQKMISHYQYTNQFVWKYLDSFAPKPTHSLGWTASAKSVRDLWIRGSRHINRGQIRIRSPYFVEEMTDVELDPLKMSAKAAYGAHDDRLRALLMAIWAAHEWTSQIDFEVHSRVEVGVPAASWQASDISADRMLEAWDERFAEISDEVGG